MTGSLQFVSYLVGLFVVAAIVTWLIERVVKWIGARRTAVLFLGVLPLAAGIIHLIHNWDTLSWWQRLLYPLAAPVLTCGFLLFVFAAVNPFDALAMLGGAIRALWRRLTRRRMAVAETAEESKRRED